MEPVLKWAGGKRQLRSLLLEYLTSELLEGHRYFEPFVGGGSIAFTLGHPNTTINDYNPELINAYRTIKNDPETLIEKLQIHEENHSKEYYYSVRAMDNDESYNSLPDVEKAARMIYLNRTCFNGLYRVNKQNHFNVPFGRPSSKGIVQADKIRALHAFLNEPGVEIYEGDYSDCLKDAQPGDVIYFDPPYDYEDTGFNKYVTNIFGRNELKQLRDLSMALIQKGCTVILSNNDTTYVRELFADNIFSIRGIEAKRYINCKPNKRSGVKEVIIYGRQQ